MSSSPQSLDFLAAQLHGRRAEMWEGEKLDALCKVRSVGEFSRRVFGGELSADEARGRIAAELAAEYSALSAPLPSPFKEIILLQSERAKLLPGKDAAPRGEFLRKLSALVKSLPAEPRTFCEALVNNELRFFEQPPKTSAEFLDFWREQLRLANRLFRRAHVETSVVFAFAELRRIEAKNLVAILEGVRMGLDSREIKARLICL